MTLTQDSNCRWELSTIGFSKAIFQFLPEISIYLMLPRMDVNGPRKVRAPQRACRRKLAWLLPVVLTPLKRDCQDLFSIEKEA